ncbi:g8681 [Coccomyxa viridis]|uniref:G8681 protein n=1 Tax=Coccomyxa viridis TaxID=1274662 RepID=A0ABP1G7C4_9CHLO
MMERTEDDAESLSVSSSGDDEVFIHDIRSSAGPQKRQKREEPVPFELLQQAGFHGGPSLAQAAERIGKERRRQQEEARAAAEEAKRREAEQEAEEEAARHLRQAKKQQSPADSLRQQLENKTHVVTQAQRRGAALRAQADSALDFKFETGQAQDATAYVGAVHKEAAAHTTTGGRMS